jgi:hypothetical protein
MTTTEHQVPRPSLRDLFDDMELTGVLEDRREYSPEDLKRMYDLDDQETADLHGMIKSFFDPELSKVRVDDIPSQIFSDYVQDTLHEGYDGWTEHEGIVFDRFLDDIKRYYISAFELKEIQDAVGRPPSKFQKRESKVGKLPYMEAYALVILAHKLSGEEHNSLHEFLNHLREIINGFTPYEADIDTNYSDHITPTEQ